MQIRLTVDDETGALLKSYADFRDKSPEDVLLQLAHAGAISLWEEIKVHHKSSTHYNQLFQRVKRGRVKGATFVRIRPTVVDKDEVEELVDLIEEMRKQLKQPHWFTMRKLTDQYGIFASKLSALRAALEKLSFKTRKNGTSTEYWVTPVTPVPSLSP